MSSAPRARTGASRSASRSTRTRACWCRTIGSRPSIRSRPRWTTRSSPIAGSSRPLRAERIAIAGDSAGAGLALALLVALRDAGTTLPACAVLLSPFADLECGADSYARLADEDPIVSREMGVGMGKTYAGDRDPSHPLASPVRAKLDGLPPLLVQVGSREVVLDDARTIVRRAREAGVPAELQVWEGMVHAWHLYASALEEGRRAIADLAAFVRRHAKE